MWPWTGDLFTLLIGAPVRGRDHHGTGGKCRRFDRPNVFDVPILSVVLLLVQLLTLSRAPYLSLRIATWGVMSPPHPLALHPR